MGWFDFLGRPAAPSGRRYGWRPALPNPVRRPQFRVTEPEKLAALPAGVDLRGPNMPAVYDQGQLGSCTANAWAGAVQYLRRKEGYGPDFTPSRLFIYYGERTMEGTVDQDSGATLSEGLTVLETLGAPPEEDDEYVIANFTQQPPEAAFAAGRLD